MMSEFNTDRIHNLFLTTAALRLQRAVAATVSGVEKRHEPPATVTVDYDE